MKVHLTAVSSNKKTGPIPVSTTEEKSCPTTCPLFGNGCYANAGPLGLHWRKVSSGERGLSSWGEFCDTIAKLPKRQLWRHNQAGDLPHHDGVIDMDKVLDLVIANSGRRGFTYTHHDMTDAHNRAVVSVANRRGFTVNVSANNVDEAVKFKQETAAPVVSIVPPEFWGDDKVVKRDGVAFVRCPAEYDKSVSCATCAACAVPDRKSVIGFTVHGTSKKKAAIIARG